MTIGPDDVRKKRYETADDYTTEELRRRYCNSEAVARIRLLEECMKDLVRLPSAMAVWAVTDEDQEVRQWYARNGRLLDYSQLELDGLIRSARMSYPNRTRFRRI